MKKVIKKKKKRSSSPRRHEWRGRSRDHWRSRRRRDAVLVRSPRPREQCFVPFASSTLNDLSQVLYPFFSFHVFYSGRKKERKERWSSGGRDWSFQLCPNPTLTFPPPVSWFICWSKGLRLSLSFLFFSFSFFLSFFF